MDHEDIFVALVTADPPTIAECQASSKCRGLSLRAMSTPSSPLTRWLIFSASLRLLQALTSVAKSVYPARLTVLPTGSEYQSRDAELSCLSRHLLMNVAILSLQSPGTNVNIKPSAPHLYQWTTWVIDADIA